MPTITRGVRNVMRKLPSSGIACSSCKAELPKYVGRYPTKCPDCGEKIVGNQSLPYEDDTRKAAEVLKLAAELL